LNSPGQLARPADASVSKCPTNARIIAIVVPICFVEH
jgi:hypothetical protein